MDSLLASYASSDEEEEHQQHVHVGIPSNDIASSTTSSYGFSSLPQPKSSPSLTFSLPPPKSHLSTTQKPPLSQTQTPIFDTNNHVPEEEEERISDSSFQFGGNPKPTSRLFSSLPDPKSNLSNTQTLTPIMSSSSSSDRNLNKKVVVLLKPPMVNQSSIKSYSATDDDDDDEVEEEDDKLTKRRKETESFSSETPSVKSFLSSIPAPKNSLGALPASLGSSGRRSIIIDADAPTSRVEEKNEATDNYNNHTSTGNDGENWVDGSSTSAAYGALDGHSGSVMTGGDPSSWNQGNENYGNYGNSNYDTTTYYESYGSVGQYDNNSFDGSVTAMPEMTQSFVKTHFKRGRNEVPTDIVEVKQDELMKNRPREDQVKLTGIAFGPSYQPASTKGKPTKLHKRKHQIGSLYFDMKQKEMELSERRAKGFLTKAETQAKYGW